LFRYGAATKTNETRSVASQEHDRDLRLQAKEVLDRPPVQFTGIQARAVGRGFATYADKAGVAVWACAILPDHVHLVLGRHRLSVEQLVIQFKGHATRRLIEEGIHPFRDLKGANDRPPKCFARGEWKVFLDSSEDIERSIPYVEDNPIKEGKPRQTWSFVTPFRRENLDIV
jgi:REP element-mobilizing transposase RayT